MNKILLIIQREYFSRVKKKSFILMTFLVPLLFIGMYALVIYFIVNSDEIADKKKVTVVDESGIFRDKLKNSTSVQFVYSNATYEQAKKSLKTDTSSGDAQQYLLHIPADVNNIELLSEKKSGAGLISDIEDQMSDIQQTKKLLQAGIDTAVLARARVHVDVQAKQLTSEGEKDAGTFLAYGVGLVTALLIYMSLFIYGTQVMRGVIEEKTSRIVEVVISSVKPFQLMLGKIIGIGLVGLTQFLLWIVLSISLTTVASTVFLGGKDSDARIVKAQQVAASSSPAASAVVQAQGKQQAQGKGAEILHQLESIPLFYTLSTFLFYFLFGYLLYSAIFAAVGSAVDNETETQQFMLPITLPLIFTFILSMNFVVNNPDSSLSFWLSIIPFTSPIAMMIRIPFGVPAWQLALSMVLLIGGFLFVTWLAARIYRVGILMYGKKVNYRELGKWLFYKE
ncbi:ABC transporter permease [Chitinophagaceae bacterium MMS25-I14]